MSFWAQQNPLPLKVENIKNYIIITPKGKGKKFPRATMTRPHIFERLQRYQYHELCKQKAQQKNFLIVINHNLKTKPCLLQ